jgi:uncharacterized membrane protein YkoI
MRKLSIGVAVAAALLSSGLAVASQSAKHQAQELQRTKLTLIEAIIAAEKADGGRTTTAEFNFKRGNPAVYEIKVLSADGKKLTQYVIDPKTGTVKDTHNEVLEKLLSRLSPENLRMSPTTLTHAVYVAQQASGGRALNADVDRKGDHLEFTVETVKLNGTSHHVKVDGSNGKVVSDDEEK